jgi:hypothetical protein
MNKTKNTYNKPNMTNPLVAGMAAATNIAFTANGAKSNASSLDACVDFFGKGAAMRAQSETAVIDLFRKSFAQDRLVALKTLFYTRDVREGQGERKTFRTIIRWLATNYTDILVKNINNIAFFGRWDDLYSLVGTPAENAAFETIAFQLRKDAVDASEGKPISLLAKWLKSVNTSSAESRALGYKTAKALGVTPKQYRQAIAALRKHIDVLETKLSAGKFNEIDYEKVPSKASLLYRKAFNKRDGERYRSYLSAVEKGEAKINASVLYPYEIIRPIEQGRENDPTALKTLDLQWKNQPNWLADNPHMGLVVCDTSGSMSGQPILVSVSLAIYFAERNVGPFKDTFITFSEHPSLQRITGQTIAEKVRGLNRSGWSMNTNLQASFNLILNTAIQNKIAQKDMPTALYIISDMQFDMACGSNTMTNFEVIKAKYLAAGYEMPRLIFWNVNASGGDMPVTVNDQGVCLVSGCSPSILKSVLSAKTFTPADVMLETLNKPRYDVVTV